MNPIFCTTVACLFSATTAAAGEVSPRREDEVQQAVKAVKRAEGCSKQVWPHISRTCLRADDKGTSVRVVTAGAAVGTDR